MELKEMDVTMVFSESEVRKRYDRTGASGERIFRSFITKVVKELLASDRFKLMDKNFVGGVLVLDGNHHKVYLCFVRTGEETALVFLLEMAQVTLDEASEYLSACESRSIPDLGFLRVIDKPWTGGEA